VLGVMASIENFLGVMASVENFLVILSFLLLPSLCVTQFRE
jgi:hypothetical protein